MEKLYNVVLWDLDGTIMDTNDSIIQSVKHTLVSENLPNLTYEQLQAFVGPPLEDCFMKAFNCSMEDALKYSAVFRDHYKNKELFNAVPIEGVFDVMSIIKGLGINQALATFKSEPFSIPLMMRFGFNKYFDSMHGSILGIKTTKVKLMQRCLEDLGENDYSKVVMIGDTEYDLLASIELGCKFVGVNYGVGFKGITDEERNNPNCIVFVDKITDILPYIIKDYSK